MYRHTLENSGTRMAYGSSHNDTFNASSAYDHASREPRSRDEHQEADSDRTGPESVRRGPWSPEEDQKLMEIISLYGPSNWVRISLSIKTRSPKQCRERYHQNLKPSLNRNPISYEEGLLIEQLVAKYGKKWAEIARHLTGRSDNAIKNWWNGGANRRRRASHVSLPLSRSAPSVSSFSLSSSSSSYPQMVMPPAGPHTPLMASTPSPVFAGAPTPQMSMAPSPQFFYASAPPYNVPSTAHSSVSQAYPPVEQPLSFRMARPDVSPKNYAAGPKPGDLLPPPFSKKPSLPHKAFNTAVFNEVPPRDALPGLPRSRSLDHAPCRPVLGYTSLVSTSPALYHAGDLHGARNHDSQGSDSSLGSSMGGSVGGSVVSTPGFGGHYEHVPVALSSHAQSYTPLSQPSRRSSAHRDTSSNSDSAGPSLELLSHKREPVPGNVFVHGRPFYAAGSEPLKTEHPRADEHGVVPPFKSLVRSINSPPARNTTPPESVRVSSLIN